MNEATKIIPIIPKYKTHTKPYNIIGNENVIHCTLNSHLNYPLPFKQ